MESLLQAVLDAPESDAPRLILADWFEEQGQSERAEFIRVQIELSAMPERLSEPMRDGPNGMASYGSIPNQRYEALRRREQKILDWIPHEWMRSDQSQIAWGVYGLWGKTTNGLSWEWRRGFIETVTCTWPDWLNHSTAILKAAPIKAVRLTTMPERFVSEMDDRINERQVLKVSISANGKWKSFIATRVQFLPIESQIAKLTKCTLEAIWTGICFELPRQQGN